MTKFTITFLTSWLLFCSTGFCQYTDEFGGFTKIKGIKTGLWHTEKIKNRHWFCTPEGNSIYLLGVNHISASNETEKKLAIENIKKWKFNSGGYETPEWLLSDYPGFTHLDLHNAIHWLPANRFSFSDVFSEEFDKQVEETIQKCCEIGKNNSRNIGYSLTDTPCYDLDILRARRGNDWVSFMRKLPANAPGKKRYISFMKETYNNDLEKFKQDYRLENINSFNDLFVYNFNNLELTRSSIRHDDEAFLVLIVEKIYRLTRKYFNELQPGALLLSENFKMHDHPVEILKLAGKYFDIISIQAGPTKGPDTGQGPDESVFDANYWKQIYELTGKPILLTDHGFSFYTSKYPRTLWHQFPSEKDAADFYDRYLKQVVKEPYIIGYMKCQYKNKYDPLRTLLKQGILKEDGSTYPLLEEQVIKTNTAVMNQLFK